MPRLSPDVARLEAEGDVKHLIRALGYGPAPVVRGDAVDALIRIGDPAVELLCRALVRPRSALVRANAAKALGRIGDARAVDPLIAALNDPAAAVRTAAARRLLQLGRAAGAAANARARRSTARTKPVALSARPSSGSMSLRLLFCLLLGMFVLLLGPIAIVQGITNPPLAISQVDQCNGTTMHPGDVCVQHTYVNGAWHSSESSYEDRVALTRKQEGIDPEGIVFGSIVILGGGVAMVKIWKSPSLR